MFVYSEMTWGRGQCCYVILHCIGTTEDVFCLSIEANVSRRPFSPDSRTDRHQLEVSWRVEIHINTMDGRLGCQKSPTKGLKYALYVITQVPLEKGVGLSGNLTYVFVTMAKASRNTLCQVWKKAILDDWILRQRNGNDAEQCREAIVSTWFP